MCGAEISKVIDKTKWPLILGTAESHPSETCHKPALIISHILLFFAEVLAIYQYRKKCLPKAPANICTNYEYPTQKDVGEPTELCCTSIF